jgi:hypothetical protein
LRFIIAAHFDKTKALGAARVTFHHDFGAGDSTESSKGLFQIAVTNRVRKVADVKFVAHEGDSSKHRKESANDWITANMTSLQIASKPLNYE